MKKKYSCNEDVFKDIDMPEKAYWLGFIMADGNIDKRCYTLRILLQHRDNKHLIEFKQFINTDAPIKEYWKTTRFGRCHVAEIEIYRRKIIEDLRKYNVIPNKTLKLKFPNIPKEYYPDFIRGYFDGDGCFSLGRHKVQRNQLTFDISSGTKSFLEKIQRILISELKLFKTKIARRKGANCYRLSYTGNRQVPKICNFLLQNSNVKLGRKYRVLMEI